MFRDLDFIWVVLEGMSGRKGRITHLSDNIFLVICLLAFECLWINWLNVRIRLAFEVQLSNNYFNLHISYTLPYFFIVAEERVIFKISKQLRWVWNVDRLSHRRGMNANCCTSKRAKRFIIPCYHFNISDAQDRNYN